MRGPQTFARSRGEKASGLLTEQIRACRASVTAKGREMRKAVGRKVHRARGSMTLEEERSYCVICALYNVRPLNGEWNVLI